MEKGTLSFLPSILNAFVVKWNFWLRAFTLLGEPGAQVTPSLLCVLNRPPPQVNPFLLSAGSQARKSTYLLYDAIYMTIWNRQASGDRKHVSGFQDGPWG